MKTSQEGIDLIKQFEGLRLSTYLDSVGVPTIGYGSSGPHVRMGDKITKEEAEKLLVRDVERFEKCVERLVKVPLSQNQFDALVSFTFNLGCGSLERSTLLSKLNEGNYEYAASEFDKWVYAGEEILDGLVRRREAESKLFRRNTKITVKPENIEIIAKQNTYLKKSPEQTALLRDNEKCFVPKDKSYTIVWHSKVENNHIKVSLSHSAGNWYIFLPHWQGIDEPERQPIKTSKSTIILKDVYYSQRDNYTMPDRTCFSSANAMLLKYLKPESIRSDDDYLRIVLSYGDTTKPNVQLRALKYFGIEARFIQNGNLQTIKNQINNSKPVPCGILHKGSAGAPSGTGHWITVFGYEEDKMAPGGGWFIVNDPYGELDHRTGVYIHTNGRLLKYSYNLFNERWTVDGDNDGWSIIV